MTTSKQNAPRVLAVIPARGGSKGIPGKNIIDLAGKPLIAWTIEAGLAAKCIARTIVSSEDEAILKVAREWGAETPFVRPDSLAQDSTPGVAPILHAVQTLAEQGEHYEAILCLQPTSPLRTAAHIDAAFQKFAATGCRSLVSVTHETHSPFWSFRMAKDHCLEPLLPRDKSHFQRQNLPATYRLNGAIYLIQTTALIAENNLLLEDTIGYEMPEDVSLDIDTPVDLQIAAAMMQAGSLSK